MSERALLIEALLRVERAAREYVDGTADERRVRVHLLRSALRDLDDLRERIDAARQKAAS